MSTPFHYCRRWNELCRPLILQGDGIRSALLFQKRNAKPWKRLARERQRASAASASAATIGMTRLSSTYLDEKSSVAHAAAAARMRLGHLKEKQARTRTDERKKAAVPSADFPQKDRFPHLKPIIEEMGSDTARTKIEADAILLSKKSIVARQETR